MSDILLRVTAVDYEKTEDGDDILIQLAGRDEHGDRRILHVEDAVPYFYAREDEAYLVEDEDEVREVRTGYESAVEDIPLARIDVDVPGNAGERSSDKNLTEDFTDTWESDIPFYRRVSIDYDLTGHIRVPDSDKCSIDDIETEIDVSGDEIIDPRILIADIEVVPEEDISFEQMKEEAEAPITHISMWDSYEDEYIALHLDPEGRIDTSEVGAMLDEHTAPESLSQERERDIIIRSYETPESLLSGFLSVIDDRRPDLTSGWNWIDFDWEYIIDYMDGVELPNGQSIHDLSDIGWVSGYQTERKVDCFPAFDMLDAYKKMTIPFEGEKRSWSLDYVAKEELGVGKLPGGSVKWEWENAPNQLLAYNIIDTMLCVAIEREQGLHDFFFELAELSQVQIYDTFSEMRLVDGYIMSRAGDDEILPTMEEKDIPENAGGLVLEPSDGIREWVGVHDLASLYPSVIISWNISPETIHWYDDETPQEVMADGGVSVAETGNHLDAPWLPDADQADGGQFDHDDIDFDVMWTDLTREGIIPKYLKRLFPERQFRKDARDEYDPDHELYDVWDRKQAAVKVIMNSFYGVSSNDYWRLGTHGLGDAITSTARYALWKGKEIVQDEGYEVYYGDSVPANEPVLIRHTNGDIDIREIQELESLSDVDVWSEDGFTEVNEVIRKPNRKRIFETETKKGSVRTTEDHGLLTENGSEIRPEDVSEGECLLHGAMTQIRANREPGEWGSEAKYDIGRDVAWLYGFFAAEGHCRFHKDAGDYGKNTFRITNQDLDELERCQSILRDEFGYETRIGDYRESSNVYTLYLISDDHRPIIDEWRDRFYSGEAKKVPREMLNASIEKQRAFLRGYYAGDGHTEDRYVKEFQTMDTKSRPLATGLCLLLNRLGGKHYVNTQHRENGTYYRIAHVEQHRDDPTRVREVNEVEYKGDYVYDLSTDNGHFHAGVGSMIVHNTDSVMVSLADSEEDKPKALTRGEELEETINSRMDECIDASGLEGEHPFIDDDLHGTDRHALEYEFEKLYRRFIQVGTKKRYAGRIVWKEGKDKDGEIDTVGFESQRSDSPELTEEVQPEVINRILGGEGFDEVSEYVRDLIDDIKTQEMDLYKVALPKSINQPLEEYGNTQSARAARFSNDNLDRNWKEGDDPWLYFIRKTPPMTPGTDVIALGWDEGLPEGFELDLNKTLDRALKGPLTPILSEVGWRWTELKKGAQTQSADGDWDTSEWDSEEDDEEEEETDEWGF